MNGLQSHVAASSQPCFWPSVLLLLAGALGWILVLVPCLSSQGLSDPHYLLLWDWDYGWGQSLHWLMLSSWLGCLPGAAGPCCPQGKTTLWVQSVVMGNAGILTTGLSQQVYLSVVWVDVAVEWVFDRIIIIVMALCDSSYARMVLNEKRTLSSNFLLHSKWLLYNT